MIWDGGKGGSVRLAVVFVVLSADLLALCQDSGSDSVRDVEQLTQNKPIVGFLDANEAREVRFGISQAGKESFPDVLISLFITNSGGDADIVCMPFQSFLDGVRSYPWHSTHSQGPDEIFLSSKSKDFQEAVIDVPVKRNGQETTIKAAAFQCWVVGASRAGTNFALEADVRHNGLELVPEEQNALRDLHAVCCADPKSCEHWPTDLTGGSKRSKGSTEPLFDFCHIHGNTCDAEGRLTRLNIDNYDLHCNLPSLLLQSFKGLKKLEAASNRLSGDIAQVLDDLATLPELTHINLERNRFTGRLSDSKGLCGLSTAKLQFFDVQSNHIAGTVPECLFASGSKLLDLVLTRTDLEGTIPDAFKEDSLLQALSIAHTKVSGTIPPSLLKAKDLAYIGVDHNDLTGIVPEGIHALPRIHTLRLRENKIKALPPSWYNPETRMADTLKFVDVANNKISGPFPLALATAVNMDIIDLSWNKLTGTLPDMPGIFPNVTHLKLNKNKFAGSIPESWAGMGMFQQPPLFTGRLDLRKNKMLSGSLPSFFFPEALDVHRPMVFLDKTRINCDRTGTSPYVFDLEGCRDDNSA